ncbi:MAG: acyltransferase [Prevotella sp.]|nr:acyltransferase [Candidatus Equicola stercoris]
MNNTSKRLEWIDMMKGIAIIAVVAFHSDFHFHHSTLLPVWSLFANSWHVGVFFVLCGFFIREDSLQNTPGFIKSRLLPLYFRLIIAFAICILLHNSFFKLGIYDENIEYSGRHILPYTFPEIIKNLLYACIGAGREPVLSALWFVYCLLVSFVILSIISKITRKTVRDDKKYEYARGIVIFTLCTVAHAVQELTDIHIPRYGNVFTITWLIYLGYIVWNRSHLQFNNWRVAVIALILFYLCNIFFGPNLLVTNTYHNVLSMTLCILSVMYFLAYVSKKAEGTYVSHALSVIGRNSFSIMTWHILSFKALTAVLNTCGYNYSLVTLNSPETDDIIIYLLYTIVGVMLPIILLNRINK